MSKKHSFGVGNVNRPTPAKWSKFGASCVAVSIFISGYGLTSGNAIVGYVGLGIGGLGTFLSTMFAEN